MRMAAKRGRRAHYTGLFQFHLRLLLPDLRKLRYMWRFCAALPLSLNLITNGQQIWRTGDSSRFHRTHCVCERGACQWLRQQTYRRTILARAQRGKSCFGKSNIRSSMATHTCATRGSTPAPPPSHSRCGTTARHAEGFQKVRLEKGRRLGGHAAWPGAAELLDVERGAARVEPR
jgi:hypothetical protein